MNKSHGSPFDCGSADAYYGRKPIPHKIDHDGDIARKVTQLSSAERKEYWLGYDEETDRKDWGDD